MLFSKRQLGKSKKKKKIFGFRVECSGRFPKKVRFGSRDAAGNT